MVSATVNGALGWIFDDPGNPVDMPNAPYEYRKIIPLFFDFFSKNGYY
jgi:hypothetical protein